MCVNVTINKASPAIRGIHKVGKQRETYGLSYSCKPIHFVN